MGLLAWWLSRRGTGSFAPGAGTAGPTGTEKGPGIPTDEFLYPRYCVTAKALQWDDCLMGAQPDPVPYAIEQGNLDAGIAMQGASPQWYQLFHEQVEVPAGNVRISDLWPYHFQLANGMLAGRVARADQAGRLYQRILDEIAQNKKTIQDLQIANQVISAVASFIPVIGGAIQLAVGTGISEGIKGGVANITNDAEALTSVGQIRTGLGQGSPEGQMWLSNKDANKAPDPNMIYGQGGHMELYTVGLSSMGGYYTDALGNACSSGEAVYYPKVTVNGSTFQQYTIRDGYTFVPAGMRMRLFAMHEYGWVLPWLSPQAGLDFNRDKTTRLAGRAAVLRAFDVMSTMLDPLPLPGGKGTPNRYWYDSPSVGRLMGCTLPPTDEDKRISDGLMHWGFNGEDISQGIINRNAEVYIPPPLGYKGDELTPNQAYELGVADPISSGEVYVNHPPPVELGGDVYVPPAIDQVYTTGAATSFTVSPSPDAGATTTFSKSTRLGR